MAASTSHNFEPVVAHPPIGCLSRSDSPASVHSGLQVIRRNGAFSAFDPDKIAAAITKAFIAVEGPGAAASRRIHESVAELTEQIVTALTRRADSSRAIHIEDIQDQVELALMRSGEHKVARAYVLYRKSAPGSAGNGKRSKFRLRIRSSTCG